MSQEGQLPPFKSLGEKLKVIRQKLHESVAEVSGAVEIDETTLTFIEQGKERPSEDILMLLISHFGIREDEAAGLWQLAGYEQPNGDDDELEQGANRSTILVMAVDPRIIYSDGVQVTAGPHGVVVNFSQGNGTQHSMTTARIGMSREQALHVIEALQQSLSHSEPHRLSDGSSSEESKK